MRYRRDLRRSRSTGIVCREDHGGRQHRLPNVTANEATPCRAGFASACAANPARNGRGAGCRRVSGISTFTAGVSRAALIAGRHALTPRLWVAAAITAVAVAAVPLPAHAQRAGSARTAGTAGTAGTADTPLDIVMLVDESGSLSDVDVAREVQAAGTIAQTPLNLRSRVTVVGFGGANGVAPNQDPTTVVCQPTTTGAAANVEYLARCVNGLHRRTRAQGDDTDYASAISQAMDYLGPGTPFGQQSPAGATKAIFLMTDGGLDDTGNPQYPPDWLPAAHHAVDLQLAAARAAHVQVWPLGFGTISSTDQKYLGYLAAHGAQGVCDSRAVSRPHATVVQNPADALNGLYGLYSAAGCLGASTSPTTTLSGGQTRTLSVRIPAIADDGAISVDKGNPAIRVVYVTPEGATVAGGALGGSAFQRSGENTPVDVLHVTDPAPGNWQIRLTAPVGLSSQLVSATAFWQGAVREVITASPPNARVGQPIRITLSVLGANGPITDLATLRQIHVGISVTGDGLSGPVGVPNSNAGEGRVATTGVGDYNGIFTAPGTPGTLTFTGTAEGYGLRATKMSTPVRVGSPASFLQAAVRFDAPASVLPGQEVHGQVLFDNRTGASQHLRLALSASPAFATITSPDGTMRVPSGNSPASFTIAFARNSPRGAMLITVAAIDAANPSVVYGNGVLTISISSPPGFLAKYMWEIIAVTLLVLLILLIGYARRRTRRKAADVRGLHAMLRRDGEAVCPDLKAPSRWADAFRFGIQDADGPHARLAHPRPSDRAYVARRGRNGQVKVTTPTGEKYDIGIGAVGEPLPDGLHLAFRDTRELAGGRYRPARRHIRH